LKGLEQQPDKSAFFGNSLFHELLCGIKSHTFECNNQLNPINIGTFFNGIGFILFLFLVQLPDKSGFIITRFKTQDTLVYSVAIYKYSNQNLKIFGKFNLITISIPLKNNMLRATTR